MYPESLEKTVRIPVQWIDGRWQLVGGGELPEAAPNTFAELLVPADLLADREQRETWTRVSRVPFLKTETVVFARIQAHRIPRGLEEHAVKMGSDLQFRYVPIVLEEDVQLSVIPGKKGHLVGGQCITPCLRSEQENIFKSQTLNEAYTKIAERFEPERRSHTGNVFHVLFVEAGEGMLSLGHLRERKKAELISGDDSNSLPTIEKESSDQMQKRLF